MYHRLARTERYRWWKPIVELAAFVAIAFVLALVLLVPLFLSVELADDGALGLGMVGLSLAILLPAALLAARIAGRPWRGLLSVEHRLRGRWLALCFLAAFGEVVAAMGAVAVAAALGHPLGPELGAWIGWRQFAPLALSVALVIPLQAAAEEVAFRGTLLQALGAWVRPAWFAIGVSSVIFGLAHDLPLAGFVSIATFGLVAAWITVRTGGLEAALALHVVNNVSLFLLEAATGRADRWITELNADLTWSSTLVDVVLLVLYAVAVARLYDRREWSREPAQADDPQLGDGRDARIRMTAAAAATTPPETSADPATWPRPAPALPGGPGSGHPRSSAAAPPPAATDR